MFITLLIVSLAFIWLLIETDCLKVRLICGKAELTPYSDSDFEVDTESEFIADMASWQQLEPENYQEFMYPVP